jgi:hypothetical protein
LEDLTPFLNADLTINATTYCQALATQMKTNFAKFELLPMQNIKRHFGAHSKGLKVPFFSLFPLAFSALIVLIKLLTSNIDLVTTVMQELHVKVVKEVNNLKDELLDIIIMSRSHLTFLRDLVPLPLLI